MEMSIYIANDFTAAFWRCRWIYWKLAQILLTLKAPPEPCEACFIMDVHALFYCLWTVEQKHLTTPHSKPRKSNKIFFFLIPIGFVWSMMLQNIG